jgi:hypothetical protein
MSIERLDDLIGALTVIAMRESGANQNGYKISNAEPLAHRNNDPGIHK